MMFMCGDCSRDNGLSLEQRKELALSLPVGESVCGCGKTVIYDGFRLKTLQANNQSIIDVINL